MASQIFKQPFHFFPLPKLKRFIVLRRDLAGIIMASGATIALLLSFRIRRVLCLRLFVISLNVYVSLSDASLFLTDGILIARLGR